MPYFDTQWQRTQIVGAHAEPAAPGKPSQAFPGLRTLRFTLVGAHDVHDHVTYFLIRYPRTGGCPYTTLCAYLQRLTQGEPAVSVDNGATAILE